MDDPKKKKNSRSLSDGGFFLASSLLLPTSIPSFLLPLDVGASSLTGNGFSREYLEKSTLLPLLWKTNPVMFSPRRSFTASIPSLELLTEVVDNVPKRSPFLVDSDELIHLEAPLRRPQKLNRLKGVTTDQ